MDAHNAIYAPESERLPIRPDDLLQFRLGRLLLLLDTVQQQTNLKPLDIERLGYYDFFSDNPLLIFDNESKEFRSILLAGFETKNLSYQSSAQRFSNRRARIQHDLALLVSYKTAQVKVTQGKIAYSITAGGQELVAGMHALYARAYQRSARLVVTRLNRLSDSRLQEEAKRWLRAEHLLIDLYQPGLA